MWTPGGAVECQPPSQVKPTCSSAPPEKNTLEQHTDSMRNFSEKSKKPCHCTKSLCLKLYCDCFANGEICNNCSCVNCCNNMEHETIRNKAIKTCLGRNPDAFNSKMHSSVQGAKGSYTRGCNCKSSGCLKNYCECYKCVSCSNYSRSKVKESAVQKSSHPDDNNTHHTTKNRNSVTCITNAVVEATCRCLVAHAEEAEKGGFSEAQAERDTLKEFGHCLTQIIHFMSRHTHTQS
ncbi:spexin prohormone 2 isoform X3 [Silurus meridionalis]|uniref:spexin prohormone 2 isoform X3 n=2 Tax=Silurus meridionalis TaxID=175797 RepID=UPI001EEC2364|nr:spexin prohormone 2 isoform X3 [Silurus meridionalis]